MGMLIVGHTCYDHLYICKYYPTEDSKVGSTTETNRCIDQYNQRGGNASNSSTILSLLKANVYYFGTIANTFEGRFIKDDFQSFGINLKYAIFKEAASPLSSVTIAEDTGSRTIIHSNKNMPEPTLEEFQRINLKEFDWIHFEGRNSLQVCEMIKHIRKFSLETCHQITVSVEVEKVSKTLDPLIPLADVVYVSKEFANSKGFNNMQEAAKGIAKLANEWATVICPWGSEGAAAFHRPSETLVTSPADPPANIIDTLGAGDCFIASSIYALWQKWELPVALSFGCSIAGIKIGVKGWHRLRKAFEDGETLQQLKQKFPQLCL